MEIVTMIVLAFALTMIVIRRLRAQESKKNPMEIVTMVILGIALVCIILRRMGV